MRLKSVIGAGWLFLVASTAFGLPSIWLTTGDDGALYVVSDQAAELLQVEVAVAWGSSSSNPNPLRVVDVALAPSVGWTPFSTYNPLIGAETSGIYFPEDATHFFASFQTTDIASSTLRLLDLDVEGLFGGMSLEAAITIDGTTTRSALMFDSPWPTPSFGDMEPDGDVDILDFGIFADSYGSTVGSPKYNLKSDAESDGDVDIIDFRWFAESFGSGTSSVSVPEPTTSLLLAIAALAASLRARG